ncbi:MAG: integrase family protein [Neomegalonema sp.]|nr:integrase family protein [Neomegalonema sp.]
MAATWRERLTASTVRKLTTTGREYRVWDTQVIGFHIRVRASGAARYAFRYATPTGSKRQVVIGDVGSVAPDAARDRARDLASEVARGGNPASDRDAARREMTFTQLFEEMLRRPSLRTGKPRAPKTIENIRSRGAKHILKALGAKRISEVARSDVEALHRRLAAHPFVANRCLEDICAAFNVAEDLELLPPQANPAARVRAHPEVKRRDRFNLKQEHAGAVLRALAALEAEAANSPPGSRRLVNPQAVLALRVAAFTGLRIGEVQSLRWDRLAIEARRAEVTGKTGRRVIVLSQRVMDFLRAAPRRDGCPFVVFGKTAHQPLDYGVIRKTLRRALDRAAQDAEDPAVADHLSKARINDFRHFNFTVTGASGANSYEVAQHTGHSDPRMTMAYMDELASMAAVADRVADEIAAMAEGAK